MEKEFDLLTQTRKNVLSSIDGLTLGQLNEIPEGFNNNIIWNVAHLLCTQQLLCYGLAKLPLRYEKEFIDKTRKGTKPESAYTQEEISFIKEELLLSVETMSSDYNKGLFEGKEYPNYLTSYGVAISSIDVAINFNNIHEALHYGYIMAQKKALE
ncbi:MAG: DinB family protein [Cyclobacteriaceae bacterium]